MKYPNFVSMDEKQYPERYCIIGTLDQFAIGNFFDVSCWSWLQTLNICVSILLIGTISTEIDAALFNRKLTSSLESKFESASFYVSIYSFRKQLVGYKAFVVSVVYILLSKLSFDFEMFSVWWPLLSVEFNCEVLTTFSDANAALERRLDEIKYEL